MWFKLCICLFQNHLFSRHITITSYFIYLNVKPYTQKPCIGLVYNMLIRLHPCLCFMMRINLLCNLNFSQMQSFKDSYQIVATYIGFRTRMHSRMFSHLWITFVFASLHCQCIQFVRTVERGMLYILNYIFWCFGLC